MARERDSIRSIDDLKNLPFVCPANVVVKPSMVSFVKIDTNASPPVIDYCVNVKESLEYEIFRHNTSVQAQDVMPKGTPVPPKVDKYTFLQKLLMSLELRSFCVLFTGWTSEPPTLGCNKNFF